MPTYRPLKISRLRDIGWAEWDPIGLLSKGTMWDHQSFADEYDVYLLRVAGELRRGWSLAQAIDYLIRIEAEHMGLGVRETSRLRAEATVNAIQAYLIQPSN